MQRKNSPYYYIERKRKKKRRILAVTVILIIVAFAVIIRYDFSDTGKSIQARVKLNGMGEKSYSLYELLDSNPETAQFVIDYEKESGKNHTIDLSEQLKPGQIPLFLQYDERWGYEYYGNEMIAVDGCGPTSLAMVLAGLTQDASWSPLKVAQWAQKNGYYVDGSGSSWSLMDEGARKLGLHVSELPMDIDKIIDELQAGHPVICIMGPGDFTSGGHFIVLTKAKADGTVQVNDSFSQKRSNKKWNLYDISDQIRNLWAYSVE